MNVRQLRYGADNFSYVIFGRKEAMVIDGGAVEEIGFFLEKMKLSLRFVANTHGHPDHTMGNAFLLKKYGAESLSPAALSERFKIGLENYEIVVYQTPGHTDDSICFYTEPFLFTGDTLFNGTIGNCFSGKDGDFHQSVKKLMALPGHTIIYAGHDYVQDAIAFAKRLEPDSEAINIYRDRYDPSHVFSRLDDELRVNPYLRFNDPKMIGILKERGLTVATEGQRWKSLMALE
jgi:hydroxyacylglutathione hydrolase